MFRPSGTTPGHALEWSRLLVQLWELGGRSKDWMIEAATALFRKTVSIGWDRKLGGFYYTLDWSDRPDQADRFWWPCAEGDRRRRRARLRRLRPDLTRNGTGASGASSPPT